jgi:hypothetical protein
MLAKWTVILPVFVVKWLAKRYCQRVDYYYDKRGERTRTFATAYPDVLIKL